MAFSQVAAEYDSNLLAARLPQLKPRKDEFYRLSEQFFESTRNNSSESDQTRLILRLYHVATDFFGEVESIIAECGVLMHEQEDAAIRDLTGISLNLLEKIPKLIEIFRRHIKRLNLTKDAFQPGSAAFQNMQSLVARYHPGRVNDLKGSFTSAGLGAFGFDSVFFRAPKVVFSLHGIRTHATWQRAFADLAQQSRWECRLEHWYFGRFSTLKFLSPFSREAKVKWFRETYEREMNSKDLKLEKNQFPSIVAHSFGTYILGYALLKYEYIRFNKVILCGSILPIDFPWDRLIERGQVQAVRNENGVKDFWVNQVRGFVPNTGPSGRYGFACSHSRLEQQEFHYTHSEYFEKGHMREYWIAFLDKTVPLIETRQMAVAYPKWSHPWVLYVFLLMSVATAMLILLF